MANDPIGRGHVMESVVDVLTRDTSDWFKI